jgi:hypothetical protein
MLEDIYHRNVDLQKPDSGSTVAPNAIPDDAGGAA